MSLDLSAKLREILNNHFAFSSETTDQIINFISAFRPNNWIYPGVLKRQLNLRIEDAYRILALLEDAGLVESWYEYCCGHCQRVLGSVRRFNELPESFECDVCGSTMSTMENTIKIYKVLSYE